MIYKQVKYPQVYLGSSGLKVSRECVVLVYLSSHPLTLVGSKHILLIQKFLGYGLFRCIGRISSELTTGEDEEEKSHEGVQHIQLTF